MTRVALVSGGGRGIGKAISLALAEDGCDVAVNYRKDEESALETVAAIEKLGRRAAAYAAPVDDYEAIEAMIGSVEYPLDTINLASGSILMMC